MTEPKQPSPGAKHAFRMLMMALEDYFDEAKGAYKDGKTDRIVADEVGMSEQNVREIREKYFGPIRPPSEWEEVMEAVKRMEADLRQLVASADKEIKALSQKISAVCQKNGWKS